MAKKKHYYEAWLVKYNFHTQSIGKLCVLGRYLSREKAEQAIERNKEEMHNTFVPEHFNNNAYFYHIRELEFDD